MAGVHNMMMGAVFFIGGSALTFATIAGTGGNFGVLFYGAILVGAIQFIVGLFQWLAYQVKSPEGRAVHHAKVDVRLLLRSMIAIAAADGTLDDGEIVLIQIISKALLGGEIEESRIREVFNQMKGKDYLEEIASIASEVTPMGAELAVRSAVMVSLSDGEMTSDEHILISRIAAKLGVAGDRLKHCVSEAHSLYQHIIDAPNSDQNAA